MYLRSWDETIPPTTKNKKNLTKTKTKKNKKKTIEINCLSSFVKHGGHGILVWDTISSIYVFD